MSTTARKTRKRLRHDALATMATTGTRTKAHREAKATAEENRFAKPAKRGSHYTDRFSFTFVIPATGKNKGRLVPRSEAQKDRERISRGDYWLDGSRGPRPVSAR